MFWSGVMSDCDLDYKHIVGEQARPGFYHGLTDRRRQAGSGLVGMTGLTD